MNRKIVVVMMGLATVALLAADTVVAQDASTRARHGSARRMISDHTSATAALEGIGAVEGWGRVMVKDMALADGSVRRIIAAHVWGLDPSDEVGEYTLTIDGLVVSTMATDGSGDAFVRLDSSDDPDNPLFQDLPPAAQLMTATVYDASEAPTLEGEFSSFSAGFGGPQDLVYMERIRLEPTEDYSLRGIARVDRDSSDQQRFETRACGLEQGASYQVVVDGFVAGVVAVDEVGQAVLELGTADDAPQPLPDDLQPIEELLTVEWVDDSDTVVLSGTFDQVNMVGSGPLQDRQGDGEGSYGDGSGGQGEPGPHGDGDGGGGQGEPGPHGDGSGDGGPHGDGDCDGSGRGGS